MRLVVYGTLREGEAFSYALPKVGRHEIVELPGIKLYVVGDCPGAKLSTKRDKAIVELWEFDLTKKEEERLLHQFDLMEGVYLGLYERNYIGTPKGKALIYTVCGDVKGWPQIKDWKKWQKKSRNEKASILGLKAELYIKLM